MATFRRRLDVPSGQVRRCQQLLSYATPALGIVAPSARLTDPPGMMRRWSLAPCHPTVGMRRRGVGIAPCRQRGGHGARHEHVSKDAPVTRYAVMFQYEVPFTRRLFLGALFPVWPIQHPACSACTLRSACRPLHWPVIPQPEGRGFWPPTVSSIGQRPGTMGHRNAAEDQNRVRCRARIGASGIAL